MHFGLASSFKDAALIRGRGLFQYGYTKVRCLLNGSVYLEPGAYHTKYSILLNFENLLAVF